MIILGIDPGASGGIAALSPRPQRLRVEVWTIKNESLRDQWNIITPYAEGLFGAHAYIEHVHSMPRDGVRSSFAFGRSYGNLEAFLIAAGIPFERVTPSVWQREFGLIKRPGEKHTEKKNRHKAKAQELFPGVKVTHAVADALLIAEWGRRQRR